MLIVIGRARAVPARRADLLAAARQVSQATRADDGCLAYGFYADIEDPDTVIGVEMWRDRDTLDRHMEHEHTRTFLAAASGLLADEPDMAVHEVP